LNDSPEVCGFISTFFFTVGTEKVNGTLSFPRLIHQPQTLIAMRAVEADVHASAFNHKTP
jgi:hypothetical protein